MKRIEFLINEVRRNTLNTNVNKISQGDMINHFNKAQHLIQKIAMESNNNGNIFNNVSYFNLVTDVEKYLLPVDMYSVNSITSVRFTSDSTNYFPADRVSERSRNRERGYSIIDNYMYISPTPKGNYPVAVEVTYPRKIRDLGIRSGTIKAPVTANSIPLDTGYDTELANKDDYFCVVDKDGVIIQSALPIISYTGGVITTTGSIAAAGQYVVAGKYASTHSELPDSCEAFLLAFVERKIYHIDSTNDLSAQLGFTDQERQDLAAMFADNCKDAIYPPVSNTDILWL